MTPRLGIPADSVPIVALGAMGTPALARHNNPWNWQAAWNGTALTIRERELWRVRLAHLAGIERGSRMRHRDLVALATPGYSAKDAIDEAFYEHIFDSDWPGYAARERLTLSLIEKFALDHERLRDDDAFWAEMHAHFSETEIVDLCYHMVGPQLGRSRMAQVLLGYGAFSSAVCTRTRAR